MSVNQQDSEQVCKVIWVIANHHFTRRAKRPRPKIAAALYQFQEKEREKASQIRNAAKPMHGVGAYLSVVPAVALRSLSLSLSLTLFLCLVRFSERDVRSFRLKVEGVSARE